MIRLDMFEMERYIRIIALRAGLTVRWGDDNTVPSTNGRDIHLPRLTPTISEEKYAEMHHFVVHEVDHVLYTDWAVVQRNPPSPNTLLGSMLNLVEDYRIERIGTAEYHGDYLNSNDVQGRTSARITESMSKIDWTAAPVGTENMAAFVAFITNAFASVYPSLTGAADSMADVLKNRDVYNKLMPYLDDVLAIKTTTDAETVCHRIYREVFGGDPEKECKEQAEQKQKGEGKGKGGEAEDGEAASKKASSSEPGGEEGEEQVEDARVKYKDLLYDGAENTGGRRTNGKLVIEYEEKDYHDCSGYYTPRLDEWKTHDYTRNKPASFGYNEGKIRECLGKTNPNFAHQVRMLLQIRSRSKTRYGQKRGKLQTSALVRVFSDDEEIRQRVFKRKIMADTLDTAVCLLVDQSGSMESYEGGYSRFTHAATAAVMMSEVVGNILHIPCEVLSFTDMGSLPGHIGMQQPHMFIHRRYGEKLVSKDRVVQSFAAASEAGMCNNSDGDHILWAHHHLMQQKQKRKVLIIFSDGSPAGGWRGNTAAHTKHTIREIEQRSPVHIIGIGIGEEAGVDRLYQDHRVLKSIRDGELERQLLSVIEQSMR